jgi:hypothetical protein
MGETRNERHARKLAKKVKREPIASMDEFAELMVEEQDLVWHDDMQPPRLIP